MLSSNWKQDDDSKYNDFRGGFISHLSISKIVVVCRCMMIYGHGGAVKAIKPSRIFVLLSRINRILKQA